MAADLEIWTREVCLDGWWNRRRGAAHYGVPNVSFDALADAPTERKKCYVQNMRKKLKVE